MKKKTWYFYYKANNIFNYVYFGEKECTFPKRTTMYKDLQKLLNDGNVKSICYTDEKKS
jgi:hypothetical protein